MRSNAGMADRGTSTCASRKSLPPVRSLAFALALALALAWRGTAAHDTTICSTVHPANGLSIPADLNAKCTSW